MVDGYLSEVSWQLQESDCMAMQSQSTRIVVQLGWPTEVEQQRLEFAKAHNSAVVAAAAAAADMHIGQQECVAVVVRTGLPWKAETGDSCKIVAVASVSVDHQQKHCSFVLHGQSYLLHYHAAVAMLRDPECWRRIATEPFEALAEKERDRLDQVLHYRFS
jgi:hypothetical protein